MKIVNLTAALMAGGLLIAAPAFAQTAPADKQKTQDGGQTLSPSSLPNPALKQKTQESATLSPASLPNPALKQKTQESATLSPSSLPNPALKQKTQESATLSPASLPNPAYKQKTQSMNPTNQDNYDGSGKQR